MASFDMAGEVEVQVKACSPPLLPVERVDIRPLSRSIDCEIAGNTFTFKLNRPLKLSVEVNGERFANLHLFANPLEQDAPQPTDADVLLLKPAIHRTEDISRLAAALLEATGKKPRVLYFAAGMHYLEEVVLRIPSNTTVYLAGGAILVGSLVCDHVQHVTIKGRGIIYLADFHRFSALRGVRITFSQHITVEGITTIDPPHYSIYLGKSEHVSIRHFKSFSTRGWSDGIDMMACRHIQISDVFLRTSDDCIAIYGSRWDFQGGSSNIIVSNCVLWADVAHALMMGTHGNYQGDGDVLERISFDEIDILEHHEPQENYWGAIAINAGDKNIVRDVSYANIRVEDFELGQLIDLRVIWNEDYNPAPGQRIQNISFHNISYNGKNKNCSRIYGYDSQRTINNVRFSNLEINGNKVLSARAGHFDLNEHVENVVFQ